MVDINQVNQVPESFPRKDSNRTTPPSDFQNDDDATIENNDNKQDADEAFTEQTNENEPEEQTDDLTGSLTGSCSSLIKLYSEPGDNPTLSEIFPKVADCIESPKNYTCPNCRELLRYACQIKACGHRLCYLCLTELLSGPTPRCPEDQMMIEGEHDAVEDRDLNREIDTLEVRCSKHEWGCKWEGTVQEFQTHVEDNCEHTDILCVNDCGAKFQKRFLQKHLDKDCLKKIITCAFCEERHFREEKKTHLEDCLNVPLPCPNKCDKKLTIARKELDNHMDTDCPRTKIECQFQEIGCAHRCSREKMAKHMKSDIINHVQIMYNLIKKHDETMDSRKELLLDHGVTMEAQERRIGDLEKIAHSQLIWRIEDYSRKLKEAKAGNADTLFSPTFTTSKHGYRLCASVCLNGDGKGKGTHMSVFVSILKGAFDALLKWPFDYRVTFTMLDQNDIVAERKNVKFSITPNPCAENEPFLGKPKMEKNASFGSAKFVKHAEIETRNYIKEDTVFLKITVNCDGLSEP